MKGEKRSGSDLPIGELLKQQGQRLSHNRESAWRVQLNNEVWLSLGTFPSAAGGGKSEEKGVAVTCRLASCEATTAEA